MVIERFKPDSVRLIGERFKHSGRMLPEGVTYHASWVDSRGTRCFQPLFLPRQLDSLAEGGFCEDPPQDLGLIRCIACPTATGSRRFLRLIQ